MSAPKIYCTQCHKSAFCDITSGDRKYRKLYCHHLRKFIGCHQKIGTCTGVVYENKDLFLSGRWKAASYNNGKKES